jgi:hypothetical protein
VALRLDDFETQVRALTRHTGDTTRLTQVIVRVYGHHAYRLARSWLTGVTPELYLQTSSDQTIAAGAALTLATVSSTHDHTHRVDRKLDDGTYRPMERADPLDPNVHYSGRYTFREEGGSLLFGPDATFSGTVRVLFHITPATLTADADVFVIPVQLELPLVFLTCGLVALQDGDGAAAKKGWDDQAEKIAPGITRADKQLRNRHGMHPIRGGLHRVQGY